MRFRTGRPIADASSIAKASIDSARADTWPLAPFAMNREREPVGEQVAQHGERHFSRHVRRTARLEIECRGTNPSRPADQFVFADAVRGANEFEHGLVSQRHAPALLQNGAKAKRRVRLVAIDSERGNLEPRGRGRAASVVAAIAVMAMSRISN